MMNQLTFPILLILLLNFTNFLTASDIENPKVKWRFKTEGPIRASAVIAQEKIYFGSSDNLLYALNKQDGKLDWKFKTDGAITATPAVAGSSVYITSRDNVVYSIDASTGNLNWKFEMQSLLPANYGGWEYFSAAPVVSNNQLFVGSGDGHLYAFDRASGKLKWKFKTSRRIRATSLMHEGVIYQPSNDGFVYAIDEKNGKLLWKFETRGATYKSADFGFDRNSIFTQPLIKDNLLVFGSRDGHVYAVDMETHEEKWSFSYGPTWAMAVEIVDDAVYVGWSTNNLTSAIDLATGKELWQYKCGAYVYTKPLVIDSNVYIGSADGKLYKLNAHTGEKAWEYSIGREIYSSPQHDSGTLFFGSDDGYFYALEEGIKPYKAVYMPSKLKGIAQYLVVDKKITPYLKEKGFDQLDSVGLYRFVSDRIKDQNPSVIVFALPLIPNNIIGNQPETGLMRQYLEAGGKIVWMGDIPNYYEPDGTGNVKRDPTAAIELLEVDFTNSTESGNYYSKATQEGLNLGLPVWFKTTSSPVSPEGVIPLAYDEYGRVSLWMKKFNSRPGSGFISCRTWGFAVPIQEEDLSIIHRLAMHELE